MGIKIGRICHERHLVVCKIGGFCIIYCTYTYCTVLRVYIIAGIIGGGFVLTDSLKTTKPPNLMPRQYFPLHGIYSNLYKKSLLFSSVHMCACVRVCEVRCAWAFPCTPESVELIC